MHLLNWRRRLGRKRGDTDCGHRLRTGGYAKKTSCHVRIFHFSGRRKMIWLATSVDFAKQGCFTLIAYIYAVKLLCVFTHFTRCFSKACPRFSQKWKMRTWERIPYLNVFTHFLRHWREMSFACPPVRCSQVVSALRQVSANWRRRFCTLSLVSKRIKRRQAIFPERPDDPACCIVKHS